MTTGVGQTGRRPDGASARRAWWGRLRNGDGPTIMLRADMQALPVREETGLPYASAETATDSTGKRAPVMHAYGPDMHVTWLIGAATVLAQMRDAWKGTLMPVFQRRGKDGIRRPSQA